MYLFNKKRGTDLHLIPIFAFKLCSNTIIQASDLTIKRFLVHLLLMLLLLVLVFGIVLFWLKIYTNHGQKLELKNYVNESYVDAAKDADKRDFQLIVKDSVHKVGMPGGIVLSQNPPGGALVKENRKIYVDVTKYKADQIPLESISEMYGRNFSSTKEMLSYLDIKTNILGYRHDPGEPDFILEVKYNGSLIEGASGRKRNVNIEKGATLDFVLSKLDGGEVELPDLVCRRYGQLGFLLAGYRLKLGSIERSGAITDQNSAFVIAQNPPYREGAMIGKGQSLEITIQQKQPESCK